MAGLLYGSGLRLMECVRLRIKDVDFELAQITVRDAKGGKDRVTMLPINLAEPLRRHLSRVKAQHEQDLEDGFGSVHLPFALGRKMSERCARMGMAICFSLLTNFRRSAQREETAPSHCRRNFAEHVKASRR